LGETVTLKETARRIRNLAKTYGTGAVFDPVAKTFAEGAVRRIVRGIGPDGTPHPLRSPLTASISGGPKPGRDTGKMQKGIHGIAQGDGKSVRIIWGSPEPYALTYDQGATITPIPPRRMLAVPMTPEAKRFKSPWDYARAHQVKLHCFPFGRRERPRSLVEFTLRGVIPVYALLTKAVIPKRPFLAPDQKDIGSFWRYVKGLTRETLEGKRGG